MKWIKRLLQDKPLKQQNIHSTSPLPVSTNLQHNIDKMREMLFFSEDIKTRNIMLNQHHCSILFLESLVDKTKIQQEVIRPLLENDHTIDLKQIITSPDIQSVSNLTFVIESLLRGYCVIFLEGFSVAYLIDVAEAHKRSITEPDNEGVVRGSHSGFVENLSVNLYEIRNRLENPHLVVKFITLGKETNTKIALLYMDNLAHPDLVQEIEKRLMSISTDTIISPGFIAEYIEDHPFSPFPQVLFTERSDRTVSNLMEGRVAILAEGDPTAIILPVTLFTFYQTPDDYHSRWFVGSFVRLIRWASFLIAFQLPATYIAIVGFHPEVLPIDLIYTVKSSIERVPFPPILEAILMELAFELIREAGIRLPSRVGQTIGIVGGLVIGDAVVRAGLVSFPMIIVVSLTAIASFVVPSHEMSTAIRILRFPLMLLAAMFGFIGIAIGSMWILIHLCKLEAFGTPYLAPLMPLRIKDLKDTFVRLPVWSLNERPHDPHPQRLKQENHSREWKKDDSAKE